MTPDALAGYRGREPDDELAPMEALLKRQMAKNHNLINLVNRSEALKRWMETDSGKALSQEINVQLDEAMSVLVNCEDPGSKEGRQAHFNARVCMGMVDLIGRIIAAGPEARQTVEVSDATATLEMNNV